MLKLILGVPFLLGVLTAYAAVLNVPLIALLLLGRFGRRLSSGLLAAGFGAASAYMIWRMEWFDVWRHGIPPIGYFLTAMLPYVAAVACLGWFLGGLITRRQAM